MTNIIKPNTSFNLFNLTELCTPFNMTMNKYYPLQYNPSSPEFKNQSITPTLPNVSQGQNAVNVNLPLNLQTLGGTTGQ